jgi:hypothetical protein
MTRPSGFTALKAGRAFVERNISRYACLGLRSCLMRNSERERQGFGTNKLHRFSNCETALVGRHGRPQAPPHHRNEDDIDGFRDLPLLRFFDLLKYICERYSMLRRVLLVSFAVDRVIL